MRRLAGTAALCAIAVLLAAVIADGASTRKVRAGNLVIKLRGGVAPRKLPKKRFAPITLKVGGQVRTANGSHPSAVRTIVIDFDRNGRIFTRGLPVCRPGELTNRPTRPALRVCRKALVGRGHTIAQVAFPDQAPFNARGPLLIFNGPRLHGQPSLVMHVFAHVPAPTTFVVRGKISNAPGRRFGKRVTIRVPPIASGNGSLVAFSAKIHRTWRFHGRRRSYLAARCRGRRLAAHARLRFRDGTSVAGTIVQSCRPR